MNAEDAQLLERATHTIVQQVDAMKQMVNAFSEYARAPDMRLAHFSLNQLVTEVAELYRLQDPSAEIRLDLDPSLPEIHADRGRMRQLLANLITNGIEALAGVADGCVELSTRQQRAEGALAAVICVTDNGPGFRKETARPPVRSLRHRQAARHRSGTGHRETDRRRTWRPHRGGEPARGRRENTGHAASQRPGPVVVRGGRATRGAAEGTRMSAGKILVVDDELDIRRLLQEILTEEGYEVEVAADADQARAARAAPGARSGAARYLDARHRWHHAAARMVERALGRLPGRHDVGSRHGRDRGRGHAPRCLRFRRKAAVAGQAAAHGRTRAGRALAPAQRQVRQRSGSRARRRSAAAAPSRSYAASSRGWPPTARRCCCWGSPGPTVRRSRASCISPARTAAGPFVAVDCRTLREDSAAATLFGSGDGAAAPGLFEQARNGTLYLGDIEDLPPSTQRLLSGVLESGRFAHGNGGDSIGARNPHRRLGAPRHRQPRHGGGISTRSVRAALGAAGTRAGAARLRRGRARAAAPLRRYADRDRRAALPPLQRGGAESAAQLSVAGQRARAAQSHAPLPAQLPAREEIGLEEVERELSAQTPADEPLVKHDLLALPLREAREQFERAYLQQQLMLCNGKVGLLAKRVDMERTHLYRKLRSLGIEIGHGVEE